MANLQRQQTQTILLLLLLGVRASAVAALIAAAASCGDAGVDGLPTFHLPLQLPLHLQILPLLALLQLALQQLPA